MRSEVARERCPFCGAKGARVTYKKSERGEGRIAGEYRDQVRCPNPKCPGEARGVGAQRPRDP